MKTSTVGLKNISVISFLLILFLTSLSVHATTYRGTLRKVTHLRELYNATTMQAKVVWHATYFSPKFQQAFLKKHIHRKYLNPEEAAEFTAHEERRWAASEEFFVSLYAPKAYANFTKGSDSFWEIILVTQDGKEHKATFVEYLESTPYEKVMFPYLDLWSKAYRVLFPKVNLHDDFKLVLRSVVGKSEMKWSYNVQ